MNPRPASRPRTRTSALACAALLALGAAGCADPEPELTPLGLDPARVELLEPGTGDAAVIRYRDEGADQSARVTVTRGFTQAVEAPDGTVEADPALPDTTMVLPLQATAAGAGPARSVGVELGEPTGSDERLNEDLATAEGFRLDYDAGGTGLPRNPAAGAPERASDTARAGVETSLRQWLTTPVAFPDDPVGVGAVWRVAGEADDPGMRRALTYRLVGRDGDLVDLEVTAEQTPVDATLDDGDVALSVIEADTRTREGRLRVDLRRPLPVSGAVDFVVTVVYGDPGDDAGPRVIQRTLRAIEYAG